MDTGLTCLELSTEIWVEHVDMTVIRIQLVSEDM